MVKTTARVIAVAAALAASAGVALAHEGGRHAMGTVREIGAARIVVATSAGKTASFALSPETVFRRGEAPARREDVRPGERVVVHGKHGHGGEVAALVKLAPEKRAR